MAPDVPGRVRGACLVAAAATILVLLVARVASAQGVQPGPPGPYVIDVRGATMAAPQAFGFYPTIPPETLVPARAFGIDAGGHVYFGHVGHARVGIGASFLQVRGTSVEGVAITARILAPQLSFNFGTSRGWSYLGGGIGMGQVSGRYDPIDSGDGAASRGSGPLLAFNVGAGARWFVARRLALTFDLRMHRLGSQAEERGRPATPGTTLGAASVGLAFK